MRSQELWRQIEAEAGVELFDACGVLMMASSGATGSLHGADNWLTTTIALARQFGIEHEVFDGVEARERYPMFNVEHDCVAYFEPGGGFVRPEAAVAAQLELAQSAGARLQRDVTVDRLVSAQDGVDVITNCGTISAGRVIVGAGAWVPDFIANPELKSLFTIRRQVLHWFEVEESFSDAVSPGRCPVYMWSYGNRAEDFFYGFPSVDDVSGGLKMASEQCLESTTPTAVDRNVGEREAATMFEHCVRGRVTATTGRVLRSTVCLYTETPDSGFVIDDHPELANVTIVSPCSGHGFKHSAAIGEALAQKFVDGKFAENLAAFTFTRF
jgi:glycine/D-amino acid oxidase-like deaminating enzyme